MKDCIICGTSFHPERKNSVCCSDACKHEHQRINAEKTRHAKLAAKLANADPSEYVECAICGFRAAELTKHVQMEHNMTSQEYRDKFGVATKCQRLIDNVSGENNPGYQHGGKLSPYSKKFVAYDGLSAAEKKAKISQTGFRSQITAKENNNSQLHLNYYTSRGYSLEEAQIALSERQSTFSLEKCIEKFGEMEGRIRWQERQDTWQASLVDKTDEEIAIMNAKRTVKTNYRQFQSLENVPGLFYIVKYDDNKVKIGITSKNNVNERFTHSQLMNREILLELKVDKLYTACMIEQQLKRKYSDTTVKGDYGQEFGWTEIFHNVDVDALIEEAKSLA